MRQTLIASRIRPFPNSSPGEYSPPRRSNLRSAQGARLCAAQAAADQHRDHRVIAQVARSRGCRAPEEPPALLRRQPVSEANTDPPHSLHPTNTGCQFRTQEAGVGRLVRDAPDGSEPKIDCSRRVSALFEVKPVPEYNGAVESETRLRTVPGDDSRMAWS